MSDREHMSITHGIIEKGTRFIVTRGRVEVSSSGFLGGAVVTHSKEHDGYVFEAVEIVGPVIAARRVAGTEAWQAKERLGQVVTINTGEVEVMPVTDEFYELMPLKQTVPA
jgi:hypothetical protein